MPFPSLLLARKSLPASSPFSDAATRRAEVRGSNIISKKHPTASTPFPRPKIFFAILVTLLLFTTSARADWTLTTADFSTIKKITVNEWPLAQGLTYTGDNGKPTPIPSRQIVSLISDRPPIVLPAKWQLFLRNGDLLQGEPLALQGDNLQFKTPEFNTIEIPLKNIAALQAKDTKPHLAKFPPTDKDTLYFKSGDTLQGLLISLDSQTARMQSDLGNTDVNLDNVDHLTLSGPTPPRTLPPLSVRIQFTSGTILTSKTMTWTISQLTLTDPAGHECAANPDQIASIQLLGGRVVWLSELDPAKAQQTSLLGTPWPMQINHNVLGGPLKIAGLSFHRGLGVHTRALLTYNLDGSFTTLSLRAGLDDSAAPDGQASLSIAIDNKTLWQQKDMTPGQISPPLQLDITNGKTLELRADPAQHLDILGRVDFVDAALIRP